MSATLARLRKRAAEFEQKKQFDRALEVYVQILDEGGKDLGDEDVPLFNRVGDMLMRKGSVTEALGYYERAVDMYAERGYLNNAIALCSKILRQSPGRAAVYYKLARISAKKGFKSDARKNFLEYADRMQKLGMADEAFRALKEFASLYPDQDDVRLVLAELLSKENRKGEALEQLQSLYEKLQSEGRAAEARATVDRMRAIDPSVTPREGSETQSSAPGDLVFLDLSDAEPPRSTPNQDGAAQPASARAPMPTPVPALTGLSITFFPGESEAAPHPEGFESTAVEPEPAEVAPVARSLTPLGTELVIEAAPPEPVARIEERARLDLTEPASDLHRVEEALEDLLPEVAEPAEDAAPVEDAPHDKETAPERFTTPLSGIEFAGLELDDMPRDHASREHDLVLPGELPLTPDELPTVHGASPASAAAAEDAWVAAEEAAAMEADIAAREAAQLVQAASVTVPTTAAPIDSTPDARDDVEPVTAAGDLQAAAPDAAIDITPDDFLALPPSFGATSDVEEHAFPPLPGLSDSAAEAEETSSETGTGSLEGTSRTPRATISIGSAEAHLRRRLELEPQNWELRRQLGEALLDNGDRDGGFYELELAMVGFELKGELDRAQEVIDEILRVVPESVGHHQKRVEYAVRSRDRGRLTNSYLELADALFRTGAGDKAVAVYSRVLELDRDNERAEFALATLAPEELARLRGAPLRPGRWTDELDAIGGGSTPGTEAVRELDAPEAPAPDEAKEEVPEYAARLEETAGLSAAPSVKRIESIELPDPDWGEGVPLGSRRIAEPDVVDTPESPSVSQTETTDIAEASAVEEYPPSIEGPDPVGEEAPAGEPVDGLDATPDEPAEEQTLVPGATHRPATPQSAPRAPTPVSVPVSRTPTPTPATFRVPVRSTPTPVSAPATVSAWPEHSTNGGPPSASDSDFVDLGEWLRNTEPTRSTRMQVEDPKPTGDEQADFDEMLRRFKRGVAENVEAEDYDAHYDLGVAYKEMGLVDEAIAQFQKALRGASHRVRSYEALGQCFVEKKQFPIAAALLQRATEVPGSDDQQLVGVLYLLGFAKEHLGRPAEALPYYLRVFAVDIEFRDIAERVAAMGNLTK